MLKVGVIGLGVMGRNHARVLAGLHSVEIVSLFDAFSEPGQSLHGIKLVQTVRDFLSVDMDYAVVASPTSTHLEYALLLADAGVHALIEKPVATSVSEADQILSAFELAGLVGAVGHVERFNPALQALKEKIKDGLIGEVIQISTRRQGPFPGRIADVGVVKDLASHDIDLTSWIAGSKYAVASGQLAYRSGRPHEDALIAVGALENGVLVSHLVNWLSPFKERQTAVLGEKGLLMADTLAVDLTFAQNGTVTSSWDIQTQFRGATEGDVIKFALQRKEPLVAEHEAMVRAVLGDPESGIVSLSEGREVLRVAEVLLGAGTHE